MAAPNLWALGKCVRSAGKAMSIKFLVLGEGGDFGFFWGGGGKCRFYFYRREDFSERRRGVLQKICASLGCGALSAKCTAGANILEYFLFLGRDTGLYRNPLC